MKLETSELIALALLASLVHGKLVCLILRDHHSGGIIYVDKKHMNITVEDGATPSLTSGFNTPMKASLF